MPLTTAFTTGARCLLNLDQEYFCKSLEYITAVIDSDLESLDNAAAIPALKETDPQDSPYRLLFPVREYFDRHTINPELLTQSPSGLEKQTIYQECVCV